MLAIVENAAGNIVKADEAEERVIEELRELGRTALQGWAERKQRRVQKKSEQQAGVTRKVKKLYWYSRLDRSSWKNRSINVAGGSGDHSAKRRE